MLTRRSLLTALASLPLLGWVKPKEEGVIRVIYSYKDCHNYLAAVSRDGGKTWAFPTPILTPNECRMKECL